MSREDEKCSRRVVCWEAGKDGRVVSWKGGKGWRIVRRQCWRDRRAVTWQVGKSGGRVGSEEVASGERCNGRKVARWERRRMVNWQGGRFSVLFKSGGHMVSPRLHLFVFDVDQQWNKG